MKNLIFIIYTVIILLYPAVMISRLRNLYIRNLLKDICKYFTLPMGLLILILNINEAKNYKLSIYFNDIFIGIIIGYAFFVFSIFLVNKFNYIIFNPFHKNINFKVKRILLLICTSFFEELLWRVCITQYFIIYFNSYFVAVLLSSILFTLSHFKKIFNYFCLLDIFILSLTLHFILFIYGSLFIIIFTHLIRNALIYFFSLRDQ